MIAEAICPICGADVRVSVREIQTASMSAVCEDCLADPELMQWWEEHKHATGTSKTA